MTEVLPRLFTSNGYQALYPSIVFLLSLTSLTPADVPSLTDLPLVTSITHDSITWQFAGPVRVGQFVSGDYYVVGPAIVSSITPAPANGRNGSVLNIPLDNGISGFDDRVSGNRFRESLRSYPPITLQAGDAPVSSISVTSSDNLKSWLRESSTPQSPVKSVSILTCVAQPVASDAFRPSYCDRSQKLYFADSLKRELLPKLAPVETVPDINEFAEHFRRPWLDVCFFHFDSPIGYAPNYGREHGRAVGMASLLLMLDYTEAKKEPLLIGLVQYAVDIWGMARNGYSGWPAHGGHGSGRKWPLVFAGILLGDSAMASPTTTYPNLKFGEDMQTMYDECWTGADVVYAGHQGVFQGETVSSQNGWGPYEHLPPSQWYDNLGENYRRCCTSVAWIGQSLGARLMDATDKWDHPAFFDYCDRWMTEDDSAAVATIEKVRGWDYSAGWARQGQCWDDFVEEMWEEYRDYTEVKQIRPQSSGKKRTVPPGIRVVFRGCGDIGDLQGGMAYSLKGERIGRRAGQGKAGRHEVFLGGDGVVVVGRE